MLFECERVSVSRLNVWVWHTVPKLGCAEWRMNQYGERIAKKTVAYECIIINMASAIGLIVKKWHFHSIQHQAFQYYLICVKDNDHEWKHTRFLFYFASFSPFIWYWECKLNHLLFTLRHTVSVFLWAKLQLSKWNQCSKIRKFNQVRISQHTQI